MTVNEMHKECGLLCSHPHTACLHTKILLYIRVNSTTDEQKSDKCSAEHSAIVGLAVSFTILLAVWFLTVTVLVIILRKYCYRYRDYKLIDKANKKAEPEDKN